MPTSIALNGFGRIGRTIFKVIKDRNLPLEIVAINDLTAPSELAYLLKYDSVHGVWPHEVSGTEDALIVDGKRFQCLKITDPAQMPWRDLKVEIAIDGTGRFTNRDGAQKHLTAGARKVIITAPAREWMQLS